MRITNTGKNEVYINREEGDSEELLSIALGLMPEWLRLFARKNADYGSGSSFDLGVRGQYSDIHRKMIKLRRALWEGESLAFEGVDEIINDLIGHLFLTRHMMAMKDQAEREYAYGDNVSAVEAFILMVGNDLQRAYTAATMLNEPFATLVRNEVLKRIGEKHEAEKLIHHTVAEQKANVVVENLDESQKRLQAAGLLSADGEPRLMSREELFAGLKEEIDADLRRPRLISPYAAIQSYEFGAADQEQHLGDKDPACACHDNEGRSIRPLRDDDPVHPQDDEDEAASDLEELAEYFGTLTTTPEEKAEAKRILDKLFRNSDKQRELLSKFERTIRGY